MLELSRDGQRIYLSNSLYGSWDEQFYPEGVRGWVTELDANPNGGLEYRSEILCADLTGDAPIRYGSKAATPPPILTASPEGDAMSAFSSLSKIERTRIWPGVVGRLSRVET